MKTEDLYLRPFVANSIIVLGLAGLFAAPALVGCDNNQSNASASGKWPGTKPLPSPHELANSPTWPGFSCPIGYMMLALADWNEPICLVYTNAKRK